MFNSEEKHKQVEFFSDSPSMFKKQKKDKLRLDKIAISLSYENVLIAAIGLIMLLVACYSLGVEKGKHLVQLKQEPIKVEGITDTAEVKEEQRAKEAPEKSAPQKKIRVKVAKTEQTTSQKNPYIQVASFRTDKYAKKEMVRLENKGYKPFTATWGRYKVVCVGGYQNKEEASKDLKQLKQLYADCILHNE